MPSCSFAALYQVNLSSHPVDARLAAQPAGRRVLETVNGDQTRDLAAARSDSELTCWNVSVRC